MKYLVHFRPDSELSELVQLQDKIRIPGSGLHCTVVHFDMDEKNEPRFMRDFSSVHFHPFEIDTVKFVTLDNYTTGLELSKPYELEKLHDRVARLARQYCVNPREFDDVAKRYYHKNYLPHITLSKNDGFESDSPDAELLLKRIFQVSDIILSKESSRWIDIKKFHAKDYEINVA